MALQRLITWIVSFVMKHFVPEVLYSKEFPEAVTPIRREGYSVGYDLYTPYDISLKPQGGRETVNTGIRFEIPAYMYMLLKEKSSVSYKHHLSLSAGVIDPDYRNTVGVILENRHPFKVVELPAGTPIVQAVFDFAIRPTLKEVTVLSDTLRGERGFGGENWKDPKME